MSKTIRLGIELNHVIRNVNKQILKYYQKDIDDSIDIDDIDYTSDVINDICHFKNKEEIISFLYEDYPFEVYGSADQFDRYLSRDLNAWIQQLTNQEDYNIDIFFFSMKEGAITIQSSYFFLSKIGSRVRKTIFPKSCEELANAGDIFIVSSKDIIDYLYCKNNKTVIAIKTEMNKKAISRANKIYDSFRDFLNDSNKLDILANLMGYKPNIIKRIVNYVISLIRTKTPFKKESQLNSDNTI
jgi:hypothetical protein